MKLKGSLRDNCEAAAIDSNEDTQTKARLLKLVILYLNQGSITDRNAVFH